MWVLSLDSLRAIDPARRTSVRMSGTRPAGAREAGPSPRRFEAVAPWPPVPGCPLTLIWSSNDHRLQMTVTGPTIAAWKARQERAWQSADLTVTHHDTPKLHAVTAEAAHALAVALRGPVTDACPTASFTKRGSAVYAGADLLAHATSDADADAVVARLTAHPAAAVLGAGLAVAADPACGAYRIDPGWLLAHDDRPWTERAQEALTHVGCEARASGTEQDATIACRYRAVRFVARWHASTTTLTVAGIDRPVDVAAPDGPLAGVSHGLRMIDGLPDAALLEIALDNQSD